MGEVMPGVEDCVTAADENCDGMTPACQGNPPIIDLRADVNRSGAVDLADPTEDADEDVWTKDHGAIFLANIDDDLKACPTAGQTDAQLAACHDAGDTVINGPDDLEDLARLKTVPWPMAPADASATISLAAPGATYVRLFKNVGGTFTVFNPATATLSAAELQAGVELAIEGRDIVRDSAVWNGRVKVTLNVDAGTGQDGPLPDGSDTVELRVSPVMFRHHLDEAATIYASKINNNSGSAAFRADLLAAAQAAGVPGGLVEYTVGDQWNQDYFETAYMSMPGPGGAQKVIHVNFRSANHTGALRSAGKFVYTVLRGKDVAGATVFDPAHPNGMDTLNSFGNLETIPPYMKNGTTFTMGKVIRGSTPSFYPDAAFNKMITSQSVQTILLLDTEWLLVAHVDETLSFIKASTPRGWAMLAADPTLAKTMLQQRQQQGYGNVDMFVGKFWSGGGSAQTSISEVLADADVMNESAWAATKIAEQIDDMKAETGLTDAEIIKVPGLFEQASGYSVAYQPGMVNGIYLSDTDFGAPDPHGPDINGQDIFKVALQDALMPYGVTVRWIEDWDLYHRLDGEVHCGSNTTRAIPTNTKWWESGL
jgi:protein-arginine deiminase